MKPRTKKQEKPEDPMKLEIAAELGLLEKVRQQGWGSLTAQETGRIGGLITRRKLQEKLKASQETKTKE
jgi:small acid-soluble spore protein F (minor alpha/beta-type SASP)